MAVAGRKDSGCDHSSNSLKRMEHSALTHVISVSKLVQSKVTKEEISVLAESPGVINSFKKSLTVHLKRFSEKKEISVLLKRDKTRDPREKCPTREHLQKLRGED